MRVIATVIAAVLLLAGCGTGTAIEASTPPASPTSTPTPTATATASPTPSPGSVEQAEIDYSIAVCSAALQIYVGVQENTLPNYSRAQYLGLDGCVDLTEPQYEVAIDKWASLGD